MSFNNQVEASQVNLDVLMLDAYLGALTLDTKVKEVTQYMAARVGSLEGRTVTDAEADELRSTIKLIEQLTVLRDELQSKFSEFSARKIQKG